MFFDARRDINGKQQFLGKSNQNYGSERLYLSILE